MSEPSPAAQPLETVTIGTLPVAHVTTGGLLQWLDARLQQGQGSWVVTANVDFVSRARANPAVAALYRQADVIIADGMPLVWASRLRGQALPERIAGSSLMFELAGLAATRGYRLYLLGGTDGNELRTADMLQHRYPGLEVAGSDAPWVAAEPTDEEIDRIAAGLEQAGPVHMLFIAFGSPKQERLAERLRLRFPHVLMIGVGASFSLATGDLRRAPVWMQRWGLEWLHRMVQEPGRLIRRYLVDNLPVVIAICASALLARGLGRSGGRGSDR